MEAEPKEELQLDTERILRHPARPCILLGLHAEGPMSPKELSKSPIGKGIRATVYAFHFKELVRVRLVRVADRAAENGGVRYDVTDRLSQSLLDAAAVAAISNVLAQIPETLAQWVEQPYIEEITEVVKASGRLEKQDPTSR